MSLNDTSEFFYGWHQLIKTALEMAMGLIPDEKKPAGYDIGTLIENATSQFKESFHSTDGYGHLYVTSFARAKTEDHNERGIRTLWELYNSHKGYCLQFEEEDVRRMLELDSQTSNYEWRGMAEVKYGIDRGEQDFRKLCFQLSQQFLLQVIRASRMLKKSLH
ncbi:hypothetical protein MWR57_08515 [Desulfovibrionaceae bacterium CB1MN]|uniref:hypothetical protein n=1 Tax=Hydrosulfovibrio ferrireducens TaxID=2934181 RepID=UPI003ABA2ACE